MKRFQDKNIMVTGAASGIGYAVAKRIAQEDGNLALLDINLEKLIAVSEEIKKLFGIKVHYEYCDVSLYNETKQAIERLVEKFGSIQALSHNAAILRCYNTHEMTLEKGRVPCWQTKTLGK